MENTHDTETQPAATQAPESPCPTPPPSRWRRFTALFTPRDTHPKDRPLHFKVHAVIFVVCVALELVQGIFLFFPKMGEALYADGAGTIIGRIVESVTARVPFSVFEVGVMAIVLCCGLLTLRAIVNLLRHQRRILNAVACSVLLVVSTVCVSELMATVNDGLTLHRPDLVTRLGWVDSVPATQDGLIVDIETDEFVALCEQLVEATNQAYREAHGTDDLGHPSAPDDITHIDATLERAYRQIAEDLSLSPSFAAPRGPAKPLITSWLFTYVGPWGFWAPHTGEIQYNRYLTPCYLPDVIAHEKAHQRGCNHEYEAEFLGYLACVRSDDAYTRYSGYFNAQSNMLNQLGEHDEARAVELTDRIIPGVWRDINNAWNRYEQHDGIPRQLATKTHDIMLKASGVEEGLRTYQKMTMLLVAFARSNNGTCVVTPMETGATPATRP